MANRPNLVLMTADDLNWDSVGAYGCPVSDATPNLDRLAAEGVRFDHAHVVIAVCQPSRSAMMTGRYPHRSGGEAFFRLRFEGVPILPDLLRRDGYAVGILGKVTHSTPYAEFKWDMTRDQDDLGYGRDPALYARYAEDFVRDAAADEKPFFLMCNCHDPHRPFYGNDKPEWYEQAETPPAVAPSRVFEPDEVTVPGFLPDLPAVRREIAEYFSSVRRCDDVVGRVLEVLQTAGADDNTLVVFLSDNGMALPFAKTNCYLHSTKTPWIVRWPERTASGTVDSQHMICGIDMVPTFLDAAGIPVPDGVDGRSLLPLLCGETCEDRNQVFTQFNQTSARFVYPMRCIQDRRFGYIFNPWSNGTRHFRNESQAGRTMEAMRQAAETDEEIAQRVDLFLHRVPEELYDFQNDPDALYNLADDPDYQPKLKEMRQRLSAAMEATGDPALDVFRKRDSVPDKELCLQRMADTLGGRLHD